MAYPILYKANETNFEHLGVSVLSDASECFVTKEKNGIYILEFNYPINGKDIKKIEEGMLIKVDTGYRTKNQRFEVSKLTKTKEGYKIYCQHISQAKTSKNALRPDISVDGDATRALLTWRDNLLDSREEFFVWSDILTNNKTTWKIENIDNAREALGGKAGSILDVWGGEYEFDNLNIRLHKQMGVDSPTIIAYGKNLLDLEQEQSILETYTTVFPFKKYTDDNNREQLITLPEILIDSPHVGKFTHKRILKIDFSNDDDLKTVEHLRNKANSYIKSNNVGVPSVNLKLNYQDLSKVEGIFDTPALEEVDLCDRLKVFYQDLNIINENAKVVKVVWDVILEENHEIEVGDSRASFNSGTNAKIESLQTQTDSLNARINALLEEQEAIFQRYFNEKSKEIEDSLKSGIEKAKLEVEKDQREKAIELENKINTFKTEVNSTIKEFNSKLTSFDGGNLDELRKKIEETKQIAETTVKMVGTDDSIAYNKNRLEGATEREIPLGTAYIELSHNGDGFEVGKEYTISWEAECRTHDFTDVKVVFNKPLPFVARVSLVSKNNLYPRVDKVLEKGTQEAELLHVYSGTYTNVLLSDWLEMVYKTVSITDKTVLNVDISFKKIADANDRPDISESWMKEWQGEWNEQPQYILDGGVN